MVFISLFNLSLCIYKNGEKMFKLKKGTKNMNLNHFFSTSSLHHFMQIMFRGNLHIYCSSYKEYKGAILISFNS